MSKTRTTAVGVNILGGVQDWQILQQKDGFANITLWGNYVAPANGDKLVNGKVVCAVIDEATSKALLEPTYAEVVDGNWKATILNVPAGGPYTLKTWYYSENPEDKYHSSCAVRGDSVHHVGIGDLYLIAGQSNAEGNGKNPVQDQPEIGIHQFRFNGQWDLATHPIFDNTDSVFSLCTEFFPTHSPWLCFAKILKQKLGYPIGLLPVTRGGLQLSYWDRAEDGSYFNQMLDILKMAGVDSVKGVLWYQGCSDAYDNRFSNYYERFMRTVADFRNSLNNPELPFITVQINKRTYEMPTEDFSVVGAEWQKLRAEQLRAAKEPGIYIVPSIDLTVCDGIHNSAQSNMVVGERTAYSALNHIYGMPYVCDAPELVSATKISGNEISLKFAPVYGTIYSYVIHPKRLMFRVYDSKGGAQIVSYTDHKDSMTLVLDRELLDDATISCDDMNMECLMPVDNYTTLPIIPFGSTKIE